MSETQSNPEQPSSKNQATFVDFLLSLAPVFLETWRLSRNKVDDESLKISLGIDTAKFVAAIIPLLAYLKEMKVPELNTENGGQFYLGLISYVISVVAHLRLANTAEILLTTKYNPEPDEDA